MGFNGLVEGSLVYLKVYVQQSLGREIGVKLPIFISAFNLGTLQTEMVLYDHTMGI